MKLLIIMPVYEDWECAALLCASIDERLADAYQLEINILMVDDGSVRTTSPTKLGFTKKKLGSVRVLKLRRNLGHQRAIAVALAFVEGKMVEDAVVIMDADGEDRPEDIPKLASVLQASPQPVVVFAERGRRVESIPFKAYYVCYRILHRLLTGRRIRFGNFSVLPRQHITRLVAYPELWNHYAAAVLRSKLPYTTARADRGERLTGRSKMGFVGLVIHGLSALFASYEVVSTRVLVANLMLAILFFLLLVVVIALRVLTHFEIPGWATLASGVLFLLMAQSVSTSLTIMFSVMMSRNNMGFIPARDYSYFVADCVEIGDL